VARHPFNFMVENPIPVAQAAPSLANVVPFNKRGRLVAKLEPVTSTRSSRTVMPPPSAGTEGSTSGWCGPKGVIIDFAHVDRDDHAARGHSGRSHVGETGFTATDFVAIVYVAMSVAFFPALAWLLSS
jgi:hypothetical protein